MAAKAIEVNNLTFSYPDTDEPVLKDINFSINHGEILGIIGPTGAGKSTLAMCVNGLVPQVINGEMEGTVKVNGSEVSESSVAKMSEDVGFVFQEPENQLSQMTIEEEVAFGMGNLGVPRDDMRVRITDALEQVGLTGFEKRSPLALSGGQQQRLAIAAVLAMRPSIMIMDEPTSMLDPKGKNEVYDVLKNLKDYGMTGIIIDHEVERIAAYCDKVLVLYEGEVQMFAPSEEVFTNIKKMHELTLNAPQVTEFLSSYNQAFGKDVKLSTTLEEAVDNFESVCK
ncbi:energy-coupling factor transport system ATP-binding protein/energy-coupling factor transport system ATP-binding protein [Thalassobacillus cyri]|uniref:Energy-coupling factor transport system ATP-binding protein/energy-coupling factor transport system ATP-binding protein n=1 Tax=Thalassobacillus cyri TaxID=571932 RepID=A0A1H3VQA2_9BACI|nr:ABC transporter ATP-binding protein [Thalassobacillus cyri]SDZ76871.1 energy-coupling factor transport system ATP-binding protein/energy-coupling factor transport system ATP-binding protein [Thalassobacillus cyri]